MTFLSEQAGHNRQRLECVRICRGNAQIQGPHIARSGGGVLANLRDRNLAGSLFLSRPLRPLQVLGRGRGGRSSGRGGCRTGRGGRSSGRGPERALILPLLGTLLSLALRPNHQRPPLKRTSETKCEGLVAAPPARTEPLPGNQARAVEPQVVEPSRTLADMPRTREEQVKAVVGRDDVVNLPDCVYQGGLPRLDAVEGSHKHSHRLGLGQLVLADSPEQHQRTEFHRERGPLALVGALSRDALHRAEFFEPLFACLGHAPAFAKRAVGAIGVRSPAM